MGMGTRTIEELIRYRKSGLLNNLNAVCDIGATELALNGNGMAVREFLDAFGCRENLSGEEVQRWSEGAHAEKLWRACGIYYLAVDMSTEIQTLELDLNFDSVPPNHRGRYQLVLNIGTTEHVCNQLNAMKVMHDLCAVGGLMYHVLPMSGYQNHGFFRYNAKFFWSLSRSNEYGYKDLNIDVEPEAEPLHPDIAMSMEQFGHDLQQVDHFSSVRSALRVVLQKSRGAHFKPPFDGIVGNVANEIPARYHEVFRESPPRPASSVASSAPFDQRMKPHLERLAARMLTGRQFQYLRTVVELLAGFDGPGWNNLTDVDRLRYLERMQEDFHPRGMGDSQFGEDPDYLAIVKLIDSERRVVGASVDQAPGESR